MYDIDKEFADFDKGFSRMRKFAVGWIAFCALASVGITGFLIWVVVKLLQHFQVI